MICCSKVNLPTFSAHGQTDLSLVLCLRIEACHRLSYFVSIILTEALAGNKGETVKDRMKDVGTQNYEPTNKNSRQGLFSG